MKKSTDLMGNRIKEMRLKLGLTQEELGNIVGVQRAAINKYEAGQVENMKRSTIKKLSDIFKVEVDWLLAFDEYEHTLEYNAPTKTFHEKLNEENIPKNKELDEKKLPNVFLDEYGGKKTLTTLKNTSESMNKEIPNGSWIVIDKEYSRVNRLQNKDLVLVKLEGVYEIRRVLLYGDKVVLRPNSAEDRYIDIVVNGSEHIDYKVMGKIITAIIRQDRIENNSKKK
ncbi:helix-turn-helix domain-containing protein [Peptostreptococcus faecalis]|uniref:helix-turn-helix domain-containing protein n=1 Tax=Peptostreptococcus faecalis TaxID=2045015 RepID=UPI000C7A34B9|nr:XRE family transcriptional regulator [Peptostreptococcus faecalis]